MRCLLNLPLGYLLTIYLQRQRIEEQKRKKRMTPGMVQANDEQRPRSGHRRRNDDAMRPLMSGGKPQQQMHQHGTYGTFISSLDRALQISHVSEMASCVICLPKYFCGPWTRILLPLDGTVILHIIHTHVNIISKPYFSFV